MATMSKEERLRRLVEQYETYRAYSRVLCTCTLDGFRELVAQRRAEFEYELVRFARDFHGGSDTRAQARSMDEVLAMRFQSTLF